MTNDDKSIETQIKDWLEKQGYPLEMKVALALQEAGFTTSLSDYYQDFESGETREIDVTGLRWSNFDKPVALQVCFNVECKLAHEKPWIVFLSQTNPKEVFPFDLLCSDIFRVFIFESIKSSDIMNRLYSSSFLLP